MRAFAAWDSLVPAPMGGIAAARFMRRATASQLNASMKWQWAVSYTHLTLPTIYSV